MRTGTRKISKAVIAPLAAIALIVAACGGGDDTPAPATPAPTPDAPAAPAAEPASLTFMLPSDNPLQYYPLFVAEALGYFAEENLTVNIETIGGSGAVMQQVIAENALIGMPSPPAYLNGVSRDNDIVWFYQMHYTNVFDLIAPVDGVASTDELRGQTVGVSEFSGGEVPFVRAIMDEAGLVEGTDWELIQIGEGGALTFNALQTGQAQAYASSIYDVASLNAAGLTTRSIMPESYKNYPANGFVVTRETLESQSDVLVRFVRAVNKATVFGRTNPDAALALATEGRPDLYDDENIVAAFWAATLGMMTPAAAVADANIGTPYMPGWQGIHDFLAAAAEDAGGLPRRVDLDAAITTSIVDQAMDFDVAAIQEQARNFAG
jgi:NitT/TauT family transport system substrate-binding protein